MIKISPAELTRIAQYINDISGIYLDQSKSYLFETRLSSLVKKYRCSSYDELCATSKKEPSKRIERDIIDAITTNETLFFRDRSPFELLRLEILPKLLTARTLKSGSCPRIRIWSAAASTGQELYSIAIIIKELYRNNPQYSFSLLGTDISHSAVTQASYGKYNRFEIERGLDKNYLKKYFNPLGDSWKIKDEIREMVRFKTLNLMHSLAPLGKFDIILCRNVAIYFTLEDRKKLFSKITDCLADDGYLIIGSTESLTNVCTQLAPKRHLKSIYYQKK